MKVILSISKNLRWTKFVAIHGEYGKPRNPKKWYISEKKNSLF